MLTVSIMRKIFNSVAFAGERHRVLRAQVPARLLACTTRSAPLPLAGLLWSIAPKLVFFMVGYAVVGTWVTTAGFGRRLTRLTYR